MEVEEIQVLIEDALLIGWLTQNSLFLSIRSTDLINGSDTDIRIFKNEIDPIIQLLKKAKIKMEEEKPSE